jgi:hypothetical protein
VVSDHFVTYIFPIMELIYYLKGAALAAVYTNHEIFAKIKPESILVVVCGGSGVSLELLQYWRHMFGLDENKKQ